MRPGASLWLSAPTRYARLSRAQARWALGLLMLLLAASLTALVAPGPPSAARGSAAKDPAAQVEDRADILLYESIVAGIRNGGNYYVVAADAQRTGSYPLRPFVTMRLPTLAMVQAALPNAVSIGLLYALIASVFLAWWVRLTPVIARRPPRIIALTLLAFGTMVFFEANLRPFHEIWAGLFIALSLGVWRPGRWIEAVAFALCAVLIRETAALYLLVMGGMALLEGRRREAFGWALAVGILAVAVAAHAHAVAGVVRPNDPMSPGWSGMLGFGFFVKTVAISTALALFPMAIAAPLVGLALFGWSAWNDPTALRALATYSVYALLIALFCRTDTFYWILLVAPALLIGLAFVPDALRDLVQRALDKRRITVTRLR